MQLIHIVGRKNHGKTTLIVDLVSEFKRRDIVIGTIKHTNHDHELDTPGKDSFLHRASGANPAAMIARQMLGIWLPRTAAVDPYQQIEPMFRSCRLVIVEGDWSAPGIKLEVWRQAVGGVSIAASLGGIRAVISDDPLEASVPIWRRADVSTLATSILQLV